MAPKKKSKQPHPQLPVSDDQSKRLQADKLKVSRGEVALFSFSSISGLHPPPPLPQELGNKSLQNENYAKAIELYTQAIETDGSCYAYYHNRSLALFFIERYAASFEDAQVCQ